MVWNTETVVDLGSPLPRNFLPLGLRYLRGEDRGTRALLKLDGTGSHTETIDIDGLLAHAPTVDLQDFEDYLIGPHADQQLDLLVDMAAFTASDTNRPIVVVIDIGIAYWCHRLRQRSNDGASRFAAVAFMQFAMDKSTTVATEVLDTETIQLHCDWFDKQGNASMIAQLAAKFPNSVYGQHSSFSALRGQGFAHGTAMVDLLLHGASSGIVSKSASTVVVNPVLYGIELPADAYLDRSGDTLQGVLALAVRQARMMAGEKRSNTDVHILLPFANLDGPISNLVGDGLQGTIESQLEENEHLYLPAGNLRQAQQLAVPSSAGHSQAVTWQIPTADPSSNTISIQWQGCEQVSIRLVDPLGRSVQFMLAMDQVVACRNNRSVLAAAHLSKQSGMNVTRLSIAPTSRVGVQDKVAAAGQWQVEVVAEQPIVDLKMVILRDDPHGLGGLRRHNRQSFFVDSNYHRRNKLGQFELDDSNQPHAYIKRQGAVSFFTLGELERRVAVQAIERSSTHANVQVDADYSGAYDSLGKSGVRQQEVGSQRRPWVLAQYNGSGSVGPISGTSPASALAVYEAIRNRSV